GIEDRRHELLRRRLASLERLPPGRPRLVLPRPEERLAAAVLVAERELHGEEQRALPADHEVDPPRSLVLRRPILRVRLHERAARVLEPSGARRLALLRHLDRPVDGRRAAERRVEEPRDVRLRAFLERVEEVLGVRVSVPPAFRVEAHPPEETLPPDHPRER